MQFPDHHRGRGSCPYFVQSAPDDHHCPVDRNRQNRFFSADQTRSTRVAWFPLAMRIRSIFGQPIQCRSGDRIHCPSRRTPSHENISGRVSTFVEAPRRRARRALYVGLKQERVAAPWGEWINRIKLPRAAPWAFELCPVGAEKATASYGRDSGCWIGCRALRYTSLGISGVGISLSSRAMTSSAVMPSAWA